MQLRGTVTRFIILFLLITGGRAVCSAQYLPGVHRVSEAELTRLKSNLKSTTIPKDRLDLYLKLGSLYYNKLCPDRGDFIPLSQYARPALSLSKTLNNSGAEREALLLLSDVFAQQGRLGAIDSLLKNVSDTGRLSIYQQLCHKYQDVHPGADSSLVKAIAFADRAMRLAETHRLQERILSLKKEIASIHQNEGKNDLAIKELLEVEKGYRAIGHKDLQDVYYLLFWSNYNTGDYDNALHYTFEAIKDIKVTGDSINTWRYYEALALVYRFTGQFEKSVQNCDTAYNYYMRFKPYFLPQTIINVADLKARTLLKMGKKEEALTAIQSVIRKFPPDNAIATVFANNALGYCYKALGRFDLAEKHYLEALRIDNGKINEDAAWPIAQLYFDEHRYAQAKPCIDKLLSFPPGTLSARAEGNTLFMAYKIDSIFGDYKAAIRHLVRNKELDEHSYNEAKVDAEKDFEAKYQNERKENEIQIKNRDIRLLNQRAQLQQIELTKAQITKNLTLAGILLSVIIIALIYRQYNSKKIASVSISEKNALLEKLLMEKEWLLKEVHHRVKNNLQTIISLLESQAVYLNNDALTAIENIQHRIFSMSLIHQKLYASNEDKSINMSEYIKEFVRYLKESFGVGKQIQFDLDIDDLALPVSYAIPLALVLNEATTNAIKYAFPGNMKGRIKISLKKVGAHTTLTIADNGIGLPERSEEKAASLGLKLIRGLAEDINARTDISGENGTKIVVIFEIDHAMFTYDFFTLKNGKGIQS